MRELGDFGMVSQFSNIEMEKLRISYLAWKEIKSKEFLEGFKRLWKIAIDEVELLFKQTHYSCRLQEVEKVGLSLQPNIGFAFSPLKKAYFLNVWSFFFVLDEIDASIYFRPPFLLANELVHEHAHYKFWSDHEMLNKTKDEMEQFGIEQGLEGEKYAHSEEAKFLKRLRFVVPHLVDIKLFRVRSWVRTGIPNYEIKPTKIMARKQVKEMFKSVRDNKKNLQKFTAVKSYKNEMSEQKTEKYSILSSILKLDNVKKDFSNC